MKKHGCSFYTSRCQLHGNRGINKGSESAEGELIQGQSREDFRKVNFNVDTTGEVGFHRV